MATQPSASLVAFKALANDARFEMLRILAEDGAAHRCQEFIAILGITAPAVSNHVRVLESAALIRTERRGAQLYVSLAPTDLAYQMAALVRTEPKNSLRTASL